MIAELAEIHKALSDETRLRILCLLLSEGDLCVCDLETALGITQSKASRHLRTLKQAKLVADRRDATWVYYRVAEDVDDAARKALALVREALESDAQAKSDVLRARELRKSPRCMPTSSAKQEPRPLDRDSSRQRYR